MFIKNKRWYIQTRVRALFLWLTECCVEQQMIFVCECRLALRLCENREIDTCVTRTRLVRHYCLLHQFESYYTASRIIIQRILNRKMIDILDIFAQFE
jgi:hypothetical protein